MSKAEERAMEKYPAYKSVFDKYEKQRYAYICGYIQAEKDLDVVSWIKEVSGVKELSRAKEEALKTYPPQSIAANYDTINRRDAFEYGYLKAEKDLELSWEDMLRIDEIISDTIRHSDTCSIESIYKEVLRRFNEEKGNKV